jgi:hypothetical protein
MRKIAIGLFGALATAGLSLGIGMAPVAAAPPTGTPSWTINYTTGPLLTKGPHNGTCPLSVVVAWSYSDPTVGEVTIDDEYYDGTSWFTFPSSQTVTYKGSGKVKGTIKFTDYIPDGGLYAQSATWYDTTGTYITGANNGPYGEAIDCS